MYYAVCNSYRTFGVFSRETKAVYYTDMALIGMCRTLPSNPTERKPVGASFNLPFHIFPKTVLFVYFVLICFNLPGECLKLSAYVFGSIRA